MFAQRKMVVTITGAVVFCVALHLFVFGPMHSEWNFVESELAKKIDEFRRSTFDTPLDLNNVDQVQQIIKKYEKVIEEQYAALDQIQKSIAVYAPPASSTVAMTQVILDSMRSIAQVEASSSRTRVRILQNLGINMDLVDGRQGGNAFRASKNSVRSYLVRRPTEPSRPRIHGTSGTIEFWFRPDWTAQPNEPERILFLARTTPKVQPGVIRNIELVENLISISVKNDVLTGTMKTEGYDAVASDFQVRDLLVAGKWTHIALVFNKGGQMTFYLDGNRLVPGRTTGGGAPVGRRRVETAMPRPEEEEAYSEEMAAIEMIRAMGQLRGTIPMVPPDAGGRMSARAGRRPAGPASKGAPPADFEVYDLTEMYIGGNPDFSLAADGTFDDFRIRNTPVEPYTIPQRYVTREPTVLFYEDFEDEMIPVDDLQDAMQIATTLLQFYHDLRSTSPDIREQQYQQFEIVRSMLGGVSERQTQIAREFSSYPKRLFAADAVAAGLKTASATEVFEKLDFIAPAAGIVRELFFYLVVGRDLAQHAIETDLQSFLTYRYLGGSRDLTDDSLAKWIQIRENQLSQRQTGMSEEALRQRAELLNLPLDARSAQQELEKLREVKKERFPPSWVREMYETMSENQDQTYRRVLLNLQIVGDLVAITRFIHLLEQKTHMVTIEEMDIKTLPDQANMLSVDIRCEAHFLEPPPPYESDRAGRESATPVVTDATRVALR